MSVAPWRTVTGGAPPGGQSQVERPLEDSHRWSAPWRTVTGGAPPDGRIMVQTEPDEEDVPAVSS
ncbi:hypothetical protein WMY93_032110 [Mugilogobius chulae]|uniref:Uncharacterized protein n=1 Tax=Mugilogobius chulae TaxID=88201 RepID=A0AAW0MJE3_9GOBI